MEEMTKNVVEERLVLRTEGLVKQYGKRTVVNDVSFDVKQGEIVGLLGPNGAGKTTSFYMTTGLVVPNGGHIWLGDEEVTKYPVYKRALLFRFYPVLSPEAVQLFLALRCISGIPLQIKGHKNSLCPSLSCPVLNKNCSILILPQNLQQKFSFYFL